MNRQTCNIAIIRLPDVKRLTGLSRSSIYALSASGKFPKHKQLSARAVGWLLSDIENWIKSRSTVGHHVK